MVKNCKCYTILETIFYAYEGQKYHLQVILNDFLNVKIDWQKVAATWGYWS